MYICIYVTRAMKRDLDSARKDAFEARVAAASGRAIYTNVYMHIYIYIYVYICVCVCVCVCI